MRIALVSACFAALLVACAADPVDSVQGNSRPAAAADKDDDGKPAAKNNGADDGAADDPAAKPIDLKGPAQPAQPGQANAPAKQPDAPKVDQPPARAKTPLIAMNMSFADNGDWLMSRDANEGAPAYHFNGIQYRVLESPSPSFASQPLYRCIDVNGTHFQSNDFNCEGAGREESLLGYVYTADPGNGAQEIHRCIGASGSPIVSTTRDADCDPFILQGISLGWALDASLTVEP